MSDAAEKIVEASPEKKKRARQKGDVPISAEANTVAAFLGFLCAIPICLVSLLSLSNDMRSFFLDPAGVSGALLKGDVLSEYIWAAAIFIGPMLIIPAIFVLVALTVQQSIVIAPSRIKLDLKKISPVSGIGKKFGPQALLDFLKTSTKLTILTALFAVALFYEGRHYALAVNLRPASLLHLLLRELYIFLSIAIGVGLIFALVDLVLVRFQREKRLKMSDQEARDETKENEGDSYIKSQRRQRAEKIAMSRMLSETVKADVVITNPTHYAVALKWDRAGLQLPVCVAKGTDELALRIRSVARDSNIPMREDPPTARSLYSTVDVGSPIAPEHFAAVAAAIRFADRAKTQASSR